MTSCRQDLGLLPSCLNHLDQKVVSSARYFDLGPSSLPKSELGHLLGPVRLLPELSSTVAKVAVSGDAHQAKVAQVLADSASEPETDACGRVRIFFARRLGSRKGSRGAGPSPVFATSSEVRYERSLQIREDIRDVNKCMYLARKL